eukprot:4506161-Pyramimonas_sp.AAC.1
MSQIHGPPTHLASRGPSSRVGAFFDSDGYPGEEHNDLIRTGEEHNDLIRTGTQMKGTTRPVKSTIRTGTQMKSQSGLIPGNPRATRVG